MKADEPERPNHLSWRPGGGGEEANRTRGNKGTATHKGSSQTAHPYKKLENPIFPPPNMKR
jgi:hypothetical protein